MIRYAIEVTTVSQWLDANREMTDWYHRELFTLEEALKVLNDYLSKNPLHDVRILAGDYTF